MSPSLLSSKTTFAELAVEDAVPRVSFGAAVSMAIAAALETEPDAPGEGNPSIAAVVVPAFEMVPPFSSSAEADA